MNNQEIKINCIAVDDEPLALKQMENFISKVSFLKLHAVFDNAIDALNYLKTNQIDLVFLDVEMNDFSGIQFLEALDKKPYIILITAYESYALKGYELEVSDYLLKPLSYPRFAKSVNRIFDKITALLSKPIVIHGDEHHENEFMFVKTKHQHQKVIFSEINYLESLSNYVIIRTKTETIYTITSLQKILENLPASNFFRVHKSFIVALDKIERITKNHVHIGDKDIPVGQLFKLNFFNKLKQMNMI